MLTHLQAEVLARRRALRENHPASTGVVKDDQELAGDAHALGLDIAILEKESETLRNIDEAITRLEVGTYGVCDGCDEPIADQRMQVLPFADRCVDCQSDRERAQAAAAAVPR
jgi:DnaK suppressor protein